MSFFKVQRLCCMSGSGQRGVALASSRIANDTLIQKDGFYQFTKDVGFLVQGGPQPGIEGGNANGLVEWRTKDGWVLQELDEQS